MDDPKGCPLRQLDPPVLLPDGTWFKTWEQPPAYARTHHVAGEHPQAGDDNDGSEDRPFRTIQRAAKVLQAGRCAVIHQGVYREHVPPRRRPLPRCASGDSGFLAPRSLRWR
jgi:hypothetical protein